MGRPIRIEFPGALYHVMSRGVGGMSIFKNDYDRMKFLCRVEELVSLGVLIVHTFCLMANHFHLLCETPVAKLGRWLQLLLSKYARGFNWRHSRAGQFPTPDGGCE